MSYAEAKQLILRYYDDLEKHKYLNVKEVSSRYVSEEYLWRGVYPFREKKGILNVENSFWKPLSVSFSSLQRRQDIFMAGENEIDGKKWIFSMGHFMGNFENEWLGIRPTHKLSFIRYAEFHCVEDNLITETGMFIDILGFMLSVGINPLPPQTGAYYTYPGPKYHNGLLFEDAEVSESDKTLALVNEMVNDLSQLNDSGSMTCPPELLQKTWSKNMVWYGPGGIGASYTIPHYQKQHQLPFRENLGDKKFEGHVCRFAEGNFACFFGWPNLSNTPTGGFLGLPGGKKDVKMQVVDVYYRDGDKLTENWVFIDLLYWLKQQGLDVLQRTKEIYNP